MWRSQLKSASIRCVFCRRIPYGTGTKINFIAKKTNQNHWQLTNLNHFLLLLLLKSYTKYKKKYPTFSEVVNSVNSTVITNNVKSCVITLNQQFSLQWSLYNTLNRTEAQRKFKSTKIHQWICRILGKCQNPLDTNSNSVTCLMSLVTSLSTVWLKTVVNIENYSNKMLHAASS